MTPTTSRQLAARIERAENAAARACRTPSKKSEESAMTDRFHVTLAPLFEARESQKAGNNFGLYSLTYAFKTKDGESVYAFGCAALRAGHYSEDLTARVQDVRNAFGKPGWYTLGRCRPATVERNAKGFLVLVSIDERADAKEGVR